jgi:hypothetical protein
LRPSQGQHAKILASFNRTRVRVRPYLLVFVRGDASEKLFSDSSLASYTRLTLSEFLSPGKILISEYTATRSGLADQLVVHTLLLLDLLWPTVLKCASCLALFPASCRADRTSNMFSSWQFFSPITDSDRSKLHRSSLNYVKRWLMWSSSSLITVSICWSPVRLI